MPLLSQRSRGVLSRGALVLESSLRFGLYRYAKVFVAEVLEQSEELLRSSKKVSVPFLGGRFRYSLFFCWFGGAEREENSEAKRAAGPF